MSLNIENFTNTEISEFLERGEAIADAKKILYFQKKENNLVVYLGDTKIDVWTAKRPDSQWDEKCREDIEAARGSYRVTWGDVPLFDKFDRQNSTFNYIAYVTYPDFNSRELVVEALSNRLVLESPEDLSFYSAGKLPLEYCIQDKLYTQNSLPIKPIAGESRIGALRPSNRKTNLWTIEAFAAIKLKMAVDAQERGIDYIACQLRPEMVKNIFTHNGIAYDFPSSDLQLGLPQGSVKLNRDNPQVVEHIFKYPGYFLDTQSTHELIKQYVERNIVDPSEIYNALGTDDINILSKAKNIKYLSSVLSNNSNTSKILRKVFIEDIPDGIYSSYDSVSNIKNRAVKTLTSALAFHG